MRDPRKPWRRLIKLRESLGLEEGNHDFTGNHILKELEEGDGIEIPRDKIQIRDYNGSSSFLTDSEGNVIVVFISDTNKSREYLLDDTLTMRVNRNKKGDKQPKFHFSWCSTLMRMDRQNRYTRYVSSRNKESLFKVQAREDGEAFWIEEKVRLYVCRKCLREANYKDYNNKSPEERTKIVKEFNIGKFLEDRDCYYAQIQITPEYAEGNVPINNYQTNWREISTRIREENNWRCSQCGADMSEQRDGLHVHHKNRRRNDNRNTNLQVLCALCHQAIHTDMYVPNDIKNYIICQRPTLP